MNVRKKRLSKRTILVGISASAFLAMLLPGQTPETKTSAPAAASTTDAKTAIKATNDEWKVIGPALQAVMTARQAVITYTATTGGRGGFGGFGDFPNFGTDSFDGPGNGMGGGRGRGGGFGGRGGPGGGFGGPGGPGAPNGFGAPNGPNGQGDASGQGGGRGPGGPGGRGGPGGPGGFGGANNAVSTAMAELTKTLADTTSSPEQIKSKVAAVRTARERAAAELATAQKALLLLLTSDQEATLVSLGYLD